MKRHQKIAVLTIVLLSAASLAHAKVTIDPEIRSQLADILAKPVKVFQLDLKENERNFIRTDKWFEQHFNFNKASRDQSAEGDSVSFKLQLSKNIPVPPTREKVTGVTATEPFNVWYTKEPQRRSFMKELRVPSKRSLPDKEVIEIAEGFIKLNKFCKITDNDKPADPLVISRKVQELRPDAKDIDKFIILQRAEFKRKFYGLEVINSKQIVDIHPDSREILSYKNIRWTPADETSGKSMPYVSQQELIARIDSTFARSEVEYKVAEVKAALFQTDKIIFPVLVVYTEPHIKQSEATPIERVLVISLVEGLPQEKEKRALKRPTQAR